MHGALLVRKLTLGQNLDFYLPEQESVESMLKTEFHILGMHYIFSGLCKEGLVVCVIKTCFFLSQTHGLL
jgi:hypothetical protein